MRALRRLEYRGYDSSGVVTFEDGGGLAVTKTAGRIEHLSNALQATPHEGNLGVGHTRWATHGPANDNNAHPHVGGDRVLALVHNGVIENYQVLRNKLSELGYEFHTDTDSEAVAHLIAYELEQLRSDESFADDPYQLPIAAVRAATSQLRGTYGLGIVFNEWPEALIAARLGSPLVIGVGDGEHFIASDGSPLAGHTDRIVYLADHEIALVTAGSIRVLGRDAALIDHNVEQLDIDASQVELDGFPHYMLKEIYEQPETLRERDAGPPRPRPGDGRLRRPEPRTPPAPRHRSHGAHRVRHELARGDGGRVPLRGVRAPAGRGRVRQ